MSNRAICDLESLARRLGPQMAGFGAPWCVAGGWAIDLFLGRATRPHDDVELAIFRQDQLALHNHLGRWQFDKIIDGRREPWAAGEFLELPIHEIHARSPDDLEESIEILLNQRDDTEWIFRRNPSIKLPLNRAIIPSAIGLPILAPQIVLLYKSKSPRTKDEADFEAALAALGPARGYWLAEALRSCAPSHPWLNPLRPIVVRGYNAAMRPSGQLLRLGYATPEKPEPEPRLFRGMVIFGIVLGVLIILGILISSL